LGEAKNPGPGPLPRRNIADTLSIGSNNVGGIVSRDRLASLQHLLDKYKWDIVLLQETNLQPSKATSDILKGYITYHDPVPVGSTSGRGVAIAIRNDGSNPLAHLEVTMTGADLGPELEGYFLQGRLLFVTRDGTPKAIELNCFYIPPSSNPRRHTILPAITTALTQTDPVAQGRDYVLRVAAGDANGVWATNEAVPKNPSRPLNTDHQPGDFYDAFTQIPNLHNMMPPGSFNVHTEYTHSGGNVHARLDYIFTTMESLAPHFRHSTPFSETCSVQAAVSEDVSVHHFVHGIIPLNRLASITRPTITQIYRPHRFHLNMANGPEINNIISAVKEPLCQNISALTGTPLGVFTRPIDFTGDHAQREDDSTQAAAENGLEDMLAWLQEQAVTTLATALPEDQQPRPALRQPGSKYNAPIARDATSVAHTPPLRSAVSTYFSP